MRDPYKTLGVRPDAGVDEIKAAWRTMAKAIHPDHNIGDPTATARFAEVGRAYETLKDPKKRSQYDKIATMSEARGGNGPTIMQQRQAAREAEERAKQARANAERVMEELARAKAKKAAEAAAAAANPAAGKAQHQQPSAATQQPSAASQPHAGSGQKQAPHAAPSEAAAPETPEDMVERIFGSRPAADQDERPAATADAARKPAEDTSAEDGADDTTEAEGVMAPSTLDSIISLPPFGIIKSLVRRIRGTPAPAQEKAPEIAATAEMTLDDIIKGHTITVPLADGREVRVQAAAGMADGHVVHLKGQGLKLQGMLRGDVAVTMQLAPHERFTVKGFDLHTALPITIENAVLGCDAHVEGPHGRINVTVPAWSGSDHTIRVSGQGLPDGNGGKGDLVVELRLMLWEKPDCKITDLMRSMKDGLVL